MNFLNCSEVFIIWGLSERVLISSALVDAVTWPQYSLDKPQNFYFDANKTSYIEDDYYRAEAIAYINSIAATKLGK